VLILGSFCIVQDWGLTILQYSTIIAQ